MPREEAKEHIDRVEHQFRQSRVSQGKSLLLTDIYLSMLQSIEESDSQAKIESFIRANTLVDV